MPLLQQQQHQQRRLKVDTDSSSRPVVHTHTHTHYVSLWLMHLDALSSELNDVVNNCNTPATALSLTTEAEDFSRSQAVT